VTGRFGGAVCLGNTLAHIMDQRALTQLFKGVRSVLLPGAPLVIQVLNYERLVRSGQRCLPLTFIQDEEGEAIFLRVMTHHDDGSVTFTPSLLRYRKNGDPALEVITSHNVPLHGWKRAEMEAALEAAGFSVRECFGTMGHVPYNDRDSTDLVVVAR
jgi:hypothetical protein